MSSARLGLAGVVLASLSLAGASVSAADNSPDFPSGQQGLGGPTAIMPYGTLRPRPTSDGANSARAQSANPLWGTPIELLHATRDRPLFSPSRRPPMPIVITAPPAQIEPPKVPDEPTLHLIGTVTGTTDVGYAVFVDNATHDIVRLKTGEGRDGWILQSVRRREAVLAKGERTEIVRLPPVPGGDR
jgi:general secretion pathway protein N